ncbi:hypothetical protein HN709_01025 [Candidatus Peregrinibacteria bacterium]|jgi:hypothetical protein|nr:hypothetical protein [Candidatus Peregrinibacteria bacterium]MBT7736246.1 hypothetical protein [Candidatus Peregrinibacteria bacterium]
MKKLAILFIPIFLFGCTATTSIEDTAVEVEEVLAMIDSVEVVFVEKAPLLMEAIVKGNYKNDCESHHKTKATHLFQEKTFEIKMTTQMTQPEEGETCIEGLVPFEEVVGLPSGGVGAGEYKLVANGVESMFTIE